MPIRNGGCSASCGRMARRIAANQAAWVRFGSTVSDNILIEQYLLAACIDYHRNRRGSEYHGAGIRYLFRSSREAFTQEAAARAGHTHLIGAAKNNPVLARRLEARVAREYPQHFERCAKLERDGETASSH